VLSHSYVGAYGSYTGVVAVPAAAQNHWMVSGLTSSNPVTLTQAKIYLSKWQAYMESGINTVVSQVTARFTLSTKSEDLSRCFSRRKGI